MVKLIRTRPLSHLGLKAAPATKADTTLAEVPYRGLVNFRLNVAQGAEAVKAIEGLGMALPTQPNTTHQGAAVRSLWLGPDEWLLIHPDETGEALVATIDKALGDAAHYSAKDVSQNYQTIRLEGPHSRAVLSKLTPLDIDGSVFSAGQCAQTVMAKSSVILDVVGEGGDHPTFDISVRRSFATYVWQRLVDAGLEYGLSITSI